MYLVLQCSCTSLYCQRFNRNLQFCYSNLLHLYLPNRSSSSVSGFDAARAVQSFNTRANAHNMVSEKHIAFNTFVFFICTCFCYIPWFICRFSIGGKIFPKNSACIFTVTFIYVNSTINPLLYCWRLRELRAAVKNILAKIFCKQQG